MTNRPFLTILCRIGSFCAPFRHCDCRKEWFGERQIPNEDAEKQPAVTSIIAGENRENTLTRSFAEAIGLYDNWPVRQDGESEMLAEGFVAHATAYLEAAQDLYRNGDQERSTLYLVGPLMQVTGLAGELTFKALLRGGGAVEKELRAYSHHTYDAYLAARSLFDEVKFINLVFGNTTDLPVPAEVIERFRANGRTDNPGIGWRVFFDHLRVLDGVYDRPYRSRYMTPGAVVLPEPRIIFVGLSILLEAMRERLATGRLNQ